MKPAAPELIDVDLITVPDGRRPLDNEAVSRLAKSIAEIGLRTPLTVLSVNDGERLDLVAGGHRLAAVKSLAWPTVACFVIEGDLIDAEMWEIAENLLRVDLSKEQRDQQIRRYAELIEAKAARQRQSTQNATIESKRADGKGHRPKGTVSKVAEQTGLSKDTVRRALYQPDPEQEQAAAARREANNRIEIDAAEAFAEWIVGATSLEELPQIIAWLEGTRPRQVIDAIHRVTA